jgi:hypothetical protein
MCPSSCEQIEVSKGSRDGDREGKRAKTENRCREGINLFNFDGMNEPNE